MRLLVTGASGAIGTALRKRLESLGTFDAAYLLGPGRPSLGDRERSVDVGDAHEFARAIDSLHPDVIIHLAGISGADCERDPARTAAVNVGSMRTIMTAAARTTARVIFSSSSAVYGDDYDEPRDEIQTLHPTSSYALSKRDAEQVMEDAAADAGVVAIALRTFNAYGPGLVNSLVNRLVLAPPEEPVALRGLDDFVRDYVHVDTVVDALIAAVGVRLEDGFTPINVGSGIATSNSRLLRVLGELGVTPNYLVGAAIASYSCADISRAKSLLGLTPNDITLP